LLWAPVNQGQKIANCLSENQSHQDQKTLMEGQAQFQWEKGKKKINCWEVQEKKRTKRFVTNKAYFRAEHGKEWKQEHFSKTFARGRENKSRKKKKFKNRERKKKCQALGKDLEERRRTTEVTGSSSLKAAAATKHSSMNGGPTRESLKKKKKERNAR